MTYNAIFAVTELSEGDSDVKSFYSDQRLSVL